MNFRFEQKIERRTRRKENKVKKCKQCGNLSRRSNQFAAFERKFYLTKEKLFWKKILKKILFIYLFKSLFLNI